MFWPVAADTADANVNGTTVFSYVLFHGDRATVKIIQGHADGSFSEREVQHIQRRDR
jgi:hypothetical protein